MPIWIGHYKLKYDILNYVCARTTESDKKNCEGARMLTGVMRCGLLSAGLLMAGEVNVEHKILVWFGLSKCNCDRFSMKFKDPIK